MRSTAELQHSYHELLAEPSLSPKTGDFADYDLCAPHICCGWMGLHNDYRQGATEESPFFHFKALYWEPRAVLVITNENGHFEVVKATTETVSFNAMRDHGLVPDSVGEELVALQHREGPLYLLFEQMLESAEVSPKLVWDWCDENGNPKKD